MAKDSTPGTLVDGKMEIDYASMTYDQLMAEVGKAWDAKDLKLMGSLSRLATKAEQAQEKTKKDALLTELIVTTAHASKLITEAVDQMVEEGLLDGAEGVWYARDFGAIAEVGINPACRLMKSGRKTGGGESSGKSSYIANPTKSADLLAQVGDEVMFEEETEVTIDKHTIFMAAGTTFKEAYDYSTNGGWRNRVRMALLKKAGII